MKYILLIFKIALISAWLASSLACGSQSQSHVIEIVRHMTIVDMLSIARLIAFLIVCLAGVIFAIVRWKRHKGISMFTIVILSLNAVVATTITVVRFYWIESETHRILNTGGEDRFMQMALRFHGIYNLLLLAGDVLHLLTVVFLLAAIFMRRTERDLPASQGPVS